MLTSTLIEVILLIQTFKCILCYNNNGRLMSQYRVLPDNVPEDILCKKDGDSLCARDHSGYFVCNQWNYIEDYVRCPHGTHCACQLNKVCDSQPRCIQLKKPFPFHEKTTFRFRGVTVLYHYGKTPKTREFKSLYGMIKQDVDAGKYLQIMNVAHGPGNSFELIVPDGNGQFTKYIGYKDKRCFKQTLDKFEPFGADIPNYLLERTRRLGNSYKKEDVYKYTVSHLSKTLITSTWKWTLISNPKVQRSKPLRSEYYKDGDIGADGFRYSEKQTTHWSTHPFDIKFDYPEFWYTVMSPLESGDVEDDWFRVPPFCK